MTRQPNILYFDVTRKVAPLAFPQHFSRPDALSPVVPSLSASREKHYKFAAWEGSHYKMQPRTLMGLVKTPKD